MIVPRFIQPFLSFCQNDSVVKSAMLGRSSQCNSMHTKCPILSTLHQYLSDFLCLGESVCRFPWPSNDGREDLLPNAVAPWGSRLTGLDEGDGWLRVATWRFFMLWWLPGCLCPKNGILSQISASFALRDFGEFATFKSLKQKIENTNFNPSDLCGSQVGSGFLPFFVSGIPVLSPEATEAVWCPWCLASLVDCSARRGGTGFGPICFRWNPDLSCTEAEREHREQRNWADLFQSKKSTGFLGFLSGHLYRIDGCCTSHTFELSAASISMAFVRVERK